MINLEVKNKSNSYILPLFNSYVKIRHFNLLMNTYLFYDDIQEDTFSILYKFEGKISGSYRNRSGFTVYEQELRSSEYYLSEEDFGQYVLYTFKLPNSLLEAKYRFIEGKYSKLSNEEKGKIITFLHEKYNVVAAKKASQILYKSNELREVLEGQLNHVINENAELSSVININNEIFVNNIIEQKEIVEQEFKFE